jgi:hypothetical protein
LLNTAEQEAIRRGCRHAHTLPATHPPPLIATFGRPGLERWTGSGLADRAPGTDCCAPRSAGGPVRERYSAANLTVLTVRGQSPSR